MKQTVDSTSSCLWMSNPHNHPQHKDKTMKPIIYIHRKQWCHHTDRELISGIKLHRWKDGEFAGPAYRIDREPAEDHPDAEFFLCMNTEPMTAQDVEAGKCHPSHPVS